MFDLGEQPHPEVLDGRQEPLWKLKPNNYLKKKKNQIEIEIERINGVMFLSEIYPIPLE